MELRKRHWAAAVAIAVATHLVLAMWVQRSVHQVQRAGADQPAIELILNTALRAAPADESAPPRPATTSVSDTMRKSPAAPSAPETPERRPKAVVPLSATTDAIPVESPRSTQQADRRPAVQAVERSPRRQPKAESQPESASLPGRTHAGMESGLERPAAEASELRQAYFAELQAYLERHRRYPREAQLRRQEGSAVLYFVIDHQGNVLDYRIERSSGYRLLDREVAAMLERAQPLPPAPPDLQRSRFELLLPIRFAMR